MEKEVSKVESIRRKKWAQEQPSPPTPTIIMEMGAEELSLLPPRL
jgi:hypothetical protein